MLEKQRRRFVLRTSHLAVIQNKIALLLQRFVKMFQGKANGIRHNQCSDFKAKIFVFQVQAKILENFPILIHFLLPLGYFPFFGNFAKQFSWQIKETQGGNEVTSN